MAKRKQDSISHTKAFNDVMELIDFKLKYGVTWTEIGKALFPNDNGPAKRMDKVKNLQRPLPKNWKELITKKWNYEFTD